MQWLDKACLVGVHIDDYHKQLLCYVAKLDTYSMILEDGWLQTHNLMIDWKECTMKFNLALCMKEKCLSCGVPCVEFAIDSKTKHKIEDKKLITVDDIDIKPVNAKHFFHMACQKGYKDYM